MATKTGSAFIPQTYDSKGAGFSTAELLVTFAGAHPNFDGCELMILNKIGRGEDLNHRPLGYEPF
jgi:hypothetical protein